MNDNAKIRVTIEDVENIKRIMEELRARKQELLLSNNPEIASFFDDELLSGADQAIKNEISIIDSMLVRYENDLKNVVIVDERLEENQVDANSVIHVVIEREGMLYEETYKFCSSIGPETFDRENTNYIPVSLNSPVGSALYGHFVGEIVSAKLPNGKIIKMTIVDVEKVLTR